MCKSLNGVVLSLSKDLLSYRTDNTERILQLRQTPLRTTVWITTNESDVAENVRRRKKCF